VKELTADHNLIAAALEFLADFAEGRAWRWFTPAILRGTAHCNPGRKYQDRQHQWESKMGDPRSRVHRPKNFLIV
jgi:hypothetical protein